MSTSTNNTWIIGGAVIFAGLLISAGIFFGGETGENNSQAGSNPDGVIAAAEAVGLDSEEFQSCLQSDSFQSDVEDDVNDASRAGGGGTPFSVFALNDSLSNGTQTQLRELVGNNDFLSISEDGKRISVSGALPYAAVTQFIDLILADESSESADTPNSDDIAITPVSEEDHIRGNLDAEIVIVEYSDFLCPFCAQFHLTMKDVVAAYDGNEVAWVYRQFPIPQLHPQAPRYSQASECIADIEGNEAFWDYADQVFSQQG